MRDAVLGGSGNFDYLGFLNVHPNLSTRAYDISASIGNAAAAARIRSRDLPDGYGLRPGYRLLWDRLQAEQRCCGVDGPEDYNATAWLREQRMAHPWMRHQVPASCCPAARPQATCLDRATGAYRTPCHEALLRWLQRSADLLCVLGFCVMAFLKLCFLGILRYEIREMIQKIRILSSDPSGSNAEGPVECGSLGSHKGGGDSALLLEKRGKPSNGNNNDASFNECHHKSSPV
ncbi:hypothetical protein HPB51_003010 [Rhipicephalus microplus]|uniref:Uncharacterized protein n=1 Tax=Rhipicephalus microplus TaxID=6941 RepID=A0A9J6DSY8_RHIMP|nr:hypothetical protein HPB51_003010 [Rhipicephalus microplus]